MRNKAIACLGAIVACATALAGIPATAMADDSAGLTPQYTYNSQNDNGMTFEKVDDLQQSDREKAAVAAATVSSHAPA
ncbi:MAG TPA: hypothetical protein PLJ01_03370 [Bifidobacterium adolescentis]|nr:hypothetical protein [Bifidobacterium adolescentis]